MLQRGADTNAAATAAAAAAAAAICVDAGAVIIATTACIFIAFVKADLVKVVQRQ
jgi:hypothetical protein